MQVFFENYPYKVVLASGSPRRQQFFKELSIPFEIRPRPVEETYPDHLKGKEIAVYLAQLKASAFEDLSADELLITSDTVVWSENESLAKAENAGEAKEMMRKLSGKTHEVITGVCFKTSKFEKTYSEVTKVKFATLSEAEIDYYVRHFQPFDKAGAYGIQDWIGLIGVTYIEGSFFNVMGLPTHLVYRVLVDLAKSKEGC